jgi:hypothetical protein
VKGDYTDNGADCSDHNPFDKNLNSYVTTSGDVVKLGAPGTYHVKYYCDSADGISAIPQTRKVVVSDEFSEGKSTTR